MNKTDIRGFGRFIVILATTLTLGAACDLEQDADTTPLWESEGTEVHEGSATDEGDPAVRPDSGVPRRVLECTQASGPIDYCMWLKDACVELLGEFGKKTNSDGSITWTCTFD